MIEYSIFETEFGFCGLILRDGKVIRIILPEETKVEARDKILSNMCVAEKKMESESVLPDLQEAISSYYKGVYVGFRPLFGLIDLTGLPDFSRKVLTECSKVPYGEVISYSELAKRAGSPKANRAVGNILSKNPFPILIPCHRIVQANGGVGGFMGDKKSGTALKRRMLELEKSSLRLCANHCK